jgi:hypothetical protein
VQIQAQRQHIAVGGPTLEGMAMLRNAIMALRNSAPLLISRGLVTQEQYDYTMHQLFTELNAYSEGDSIYIDTIAHKSAI